MRVQFAQSDWPIDESPREIHVSIVADEVRPSSQHLEKHTAQAEDVAASVNVVLPGKLFGAHVGGGSDDASGRGQRAPRRITKGASYPKVGERYVRTLY